MTLTTDIEAFDELSKVKATQADFLPFVRQLSVDVGLPSNTETVPELLGSETFVSCTVSSQPSRLVIFTAIRQTLPIRMTDANEGMRHPKGVRSRA